MSICIPSTINLPPNETAWNELTNADQELFAALAWSQWQALLGHSLSICPTEVRPCAPGFYESVWKTSPETGHSQFVPTLIGGAWLNLCSCSSGACGCGNAIAVTLPGPVGRIDEVRIDGVVLEPTAYRVDNASVLVRQDGERWPAGQDFSRPAGEPETWSVRYFRGNAPDELDDWAAGILALEFAKSYTGKGKCRLPANVQNITRNGVQMELRNNLFLDGTTGIREIDMLISQRNPHQLTQPSRVKSPDSMRARTTTWSR